MTDSPSECFKREKEGAGLLQEAGPSDQSLASTSKLWVLPGHGPPHTLDPSTSKAGGSLFKSSLIYMVSPRLSRMTVRSCLQLEN